MNPGDRVRYTLQARLMFSMAARNLASVGTVTATRPAANGGTAVRVVRDAISSYDGITDEEVDLWYGEGTWEKCP